MRTGSTLHALFLAALLLAPAACQSTPDQPPDEPDEKEAVESPEKPTNVLKETAREKLYFDLDRYAEQYIVERDRGNSVTWSSLHASVLLPMVDSNLDELLDTLANPAESHRREIAAKGLGFGSDGARIAPALIGVLDEKSEVLVNNALVSLYYLAYPEAPIGGLTELLSHPDADIRSNCALALFAILRERRVNGKVPMTEEVRKASGNLLFLLADPDDPYVRGHAAAALSMIGDPTTVDDLLNLLADSSSFVRIQAAAGLGQLGGEKAVPPLIETLGTAKGIEATVIAAALARIAKAKGYPCDAGALGTDVASWKAWYAAVRR